ncbi:MAG TPA: hypothetical protein VGJ73_10355 [Verrucomicrobiae bacterium]|jgi:hypothetical protein
MKKWILALGLLVPALSHAQGYAINWHKVSGGGGASSGTNGSAIYSVNGTAGQHDAGAAMTGGGYSLTGGFWAIYAVQTPGAPLLNIVKSGPGVIVSWPYPSTGFVLQQNNNLSTPNWINSSYPINTNTSSNSITIALPSGTLFFRLINP